VAFAETLHSQADVSNMSKQLSDGVRHQ
jgi:hypothetical protein